MIEYICYKKVPAGKIQLKVEQPQPVLVDTLGVSSLEDGCYQVQAVGGQPEVGEAILLPIKGALNTSLKLEILQLKQLITPVNAWQAICQGPNVAEFNLRGLDVSCDECHKASQLEFVEFSAHRNEDALKALSMQGWQADSTRQVCPSCLQASKVIKE